MAPAIEPHIFTTWMNMMRRCYYAKDPSYSDYGARGVTVCERWHSLFAFSTDIGPRPGALNGRHKDGYSLDRVDPNRGYEPTNCRWATWTEQARNKRATRRLTYRGATRTIDEWSEKLGLSRITIASRLRRGWTDQEILSTPVNREGHRVHQRQSIAICREAGISRSAFYARLKRGWSEEDALKTPKHQGQRRVRPR